MTANTQNRKVESLLSPEINLSTSSDEDEEYSVTSPKFFKSIKSMLAKTSHLTTKLVVGLISYPVEKLLSALADTGSSSRNILETYTSKQAHQT